MNDENEKRIEKNGEVRLYQIYLIQFLSLDLEINFHVFKLLTRLRFYLINFVF